MASSISFILTLVLALITLFSAETIAAVCPANKPLNWGQSCVDACPEPWYAPANLSTCIYKPARVYSSGFPTNAGSKNCTWDRVSIDFALLSYKTPAIINTTLTNENDEILKEFDCTNGWLVSNEFHSELPMITENLIVLHHPSLKVAVVAFRGSETEDIRRWIAAFKEWVWNLHAKLIPYIAPNGKYIGYVHEGFYAMQALLRDVVLEQMRAYAQQGYNIMLTGHSLGAALAELTAMDASVGLNLSPSRLAITTFGLPRSGDPAFVAEFDSRVKLSRRFVNTIPETAVLHERVEDIVTTIPLESEGYLHINGKVEAYCNPEKLSFPVKAIGCHLYKSYRNSILYEYIGDPDLPKKH